MTITKAFGVVVAVALAGCVSRSDIEQVKQNQKTILQKINTLATRARPTPPRRPRGPDPSKVYALPVGNSPVRGPNDAWVTIVESADFQCPFCKRVEGTLEQIEKKYGHDVRLVFKNNPLPFHQHAMPAAIAAECAKVQGKFWPMHDALYKGQPALTSADLEKYAKQAGVNVTKWKACLTSPQPKVAIQADQQLAARMGARGTPAFFINGRFLSGAQPFASFQALIDQELKKAKSSGIPKAQYYAKAVMAKGAKAL